MKMDESWRAPLMGSTHPNPRRKPMLTPEDFNDVFGGPPRTLLLRRQRSSYGSDFKDAYDAIFLPLESYFATPPLVGANRPRPPRDARRRVGWRWPCYDQFDVDEDVNFSSYSSKLKSINVPSRHNSPSTTSIYGEEKSDTKSTGVYSWQIKPSATDLSSISYDDDDESPYSFVSSSSLSSNVKKAHQKALKDLEREVVVEIEDYGEEEEEDIFANSYVIDVSNRGTTVPASSRRDEMDGAEAVNEVIAWARENLRIRMETKVKEEKDDRGRRSSKEEEEKESLCGNVTRLGVLGAANLGHGHP